MPGGLHHDRRQRQFHADRRAPSAAARSARSCPATFTGRRPRGTTPAALTLTPNQTVVGKNIGVYLPISITGQVFNDFNADQTKDSDDTVVQRASRSTSIPTTTGNSTPAKDRRPRPIPTATTVSRGCPRGTTPFERFCPPTRWSLNRRAGLTAATLTTGQTITGADFGNYPANRDPRRGLQRRQ